MNILKLLFPTQRVPSLDEFIPNYWAIELGDPEGVEKARKERLKKASDYFSSL